MANLTIKDIAKICGVGISTVSRAINDDPGINQNTRKRILKVIKEYNYVPNNSARNLKMTEIKKGLPKWQPLSICNYNLATKKIS